MVRTGDGACPSSGPEKSHSITAADRHLVKRISLRKAIEVFSRRLNQLEAFIREHALAVPSIAAEDEALVKKMLDISQSQENASAKQDTQSHRHGTTLDPRLIDCLQQYELLPEQVLTNSDDQSGEYLKPQHPTEPIYNRSDLLDNVIGDHYAIPPSDGFMDIGTTGFSLETPGWDSAFAEFPTGVESAWNDINYVHPDERPTNDEEAFDQESFDSSDGDKDEVISQISERMGSLQVADDGELRYFGATSNLNLLDEALQQNHYGTEPIRSRGKDKEDDARLGQPVDSALITHLISLYFTWHDPAFHVVDRRMYEEERKLYEGGTDDSKFYSETLTNSM